MPFSIVTPSIEEKQEFKWRGMSRADLPEIWKLMQVVNRVDENDYTETIDDLDREFDDPWSNPLKDGRIIRGVKNKLAAFARIFVNPEPDKENVAYVMCEVAPEARGQGLEEECMDWMQERATECLAQAAQAEGAGDLRRVIRVSFPETDTNSIARYNANGYEHARSFFKMNRDLRESIPDNPLPDGLTLQVYSEELDESLRHAFNESFGDHWGHQEVTEAEWHPFVMDISDVRRDLTLIAMDGREIAAFCINRVKANENERLSIKRGWIGSVGTRRNWRKRGIASALIAESMRRFRAEGFDAVGLGVDAENLTGALALYERLGFKPTKTRLVLEKKVG